MKIRLGIVGFGNLGRAALEKIRLTPDTEAVCVITRRDPYGVKNGIDIPVIRADDAESVKDNVDVMLMCGSSAYDLPCQTPAFARDFCVVDAFDTHRKMKSHLAAVDLAARSGGTAAVIAAGWDPGLFSLWRLFCRAAMPDGAINTFWGPGVSQGHSDAVRHIDKVKNAVQYTVPNGEYLERAREGETAEFSDGERIRRICYVSAERGSDRDKISRSIASMPHYFDGYDTAVFFVKDEELIKNHSSLSHRGEVICSDKAGNHISCSLRTPSNPHLTAGIMIAAARGAYRLKALGKSGCFTLFDVPPAFLLPADEEEALLKLM